jgi:hypothetical protein
MLCQFNHTTGLLLLNRAIFLKKIYEYVIILDVNQIS